MTAPAVPEALQTTHGEFEQRVATVLEEFRKRGEELDAMRLALDAVIERRRIARLRYCLTLGDASEIIVPAFALVRAEITSQCPWPAARAETDRHLH